MGEIEMANQRVVTLLELMLAIAVLGILLSVGVPSFTTYVADNRIANESARLVSNLNCARSEASSQASVVTLAKPSVVDGDWSRGWEICTDQDQGERGKEFGRDVTIGLCGRVSVVSPAADCSLERPQGGQTHEPNDENRFLAR
jgi:Tfp pilus assembly protein FimT